MHAECSSLEGLRKESRKGAGEIDDHEKSKGVKMKAIGRVLLRISSSVGSTFYK